MKKLRNLVTRWCGPCMAIGASLLLLAGVALAQQPPATAHDVLGFGARDVITGLLGLLMMVGGAFYAGQRSRLDKAESAIEQLQKDRETDRLAAQRDLQDLELNVANNYTSKADARDWRAEVRAEFGKIEHKVDALHERFDHFGMPPASDRRRG